MADYIIIWGANILSKFNIWLVIKNIDEWPILCEKRDPLGYKGAHLYLATNQ